MWRLGQEGGFLRDGGKNCLNYLKRGWNRKKGSGNKNFQKGGQAGLKAGCLKRWDGTPLRTMDHFYGKGAC